MATEYHLACWTCKEFLDIHKLKLVPEISPFQAEGVCVTKTQIENEIYKLKNNFNDGIVPHWIKDILPFVQNFLLQHNGHRLVLMDDFSDYFWDPEHVGYCNWKEVNSTLTTELYLPRNLVDDLKITDWDNAEKYLKTLKIFLYDELELVEHKRKFIELVVEQNSR